jgi:hypothetical protein
VVEVLSATASLQAVVRLSKPHLYARRQEIEAMIQSLHPAFRVTSAPFSMSQYDSCRQIWTASKTAQDMLLMMGQGIGIVEVEPLEKWCDRYGGMPHYIVIG